MKISTFVGRMVDRAKIEIKNNAKLAKFTLAVNEKNKETEYFRFVAWGKIAEIVENYGDKGLRVYIQAEPKYVELNKGSCVYFQIEHITYLDYKEKKKKIDDSDYDW